MRREVRQTSSHLPQTADLPRKLRSKILYPTKTRPDPFSAVHWASRATRPAGNVTWSGWWWDPIEQTNQDWRKLSKGWADGSVAWRQQLRVEHAVTLGRHFFSREENARINHEEWSVALAELLQRHGRTLADAATTPKGAQWKPEVARELRCKTSATVPWLAAVLRMGTPGAVRALLSLRGR
jgi:hypothetical protein